MKIHWTAQSIKDYLFRIASDFIAQLQNKMESLSISQDELARKLGITKGAVSLWLNHPGNISLGKMIEYARVLGMKVSVVAYEDDDPENKKGPIDSEIFKICWERAGRPRDFWDIQETANTSMFAGTYHLATVTSITMHVPSVPIKIYEAELPYGKGTLPSNVATCPIYFPVEHFAGSRVIFDRDQLPS
jgi:transcriptional regulator with XRE-family HTH domain